MKLDMILRRSKIRKHPRREITKRLMLSTSIKMKNLLNSPTSSSNSSSSSSNSKQTWLLAEACLLEQTPSQCLIANILTLEVASTNRTL
jgi:hypothetical protein